MANTKTAKKQILVTKRNAERNLAIKSKLKTMLKRARAAIAAGGDQAAAQEALSAAIKTLHKSATKGVIKKQNADRRAGRLAISFNKVFSPKAEPAAPATE
jgi:small subunit ribosomal protein S20